MDKIINDFIKKGIAEDVGSGDVTSMACIDKKSNGKAELISKENCQIAGINIAKHIFQFYDKKLIFKALKKDGESAQKSDVIFTVSGKKQSILATERLVLNCMQRMSGIATKTRKFVNKVSDLNTTILDTRKTCPTIRFLDKKAVEIGGAKNHRNGLFDVIMIKDNHIDFAGGVQNAIKNCHQYLKKNKYVIDIIIEARNLQELKHIINAGGINRILLDNFSIQKTHKAVSLVKQKYPLESSGNIQLHNVRKYALCGVDYISIGGLTHSIKSIDLSMRSI
ncbi:MAG: nicotinate-nucleotide diphosphorylase (carboxylating) [Flavobacteriales bacterium]|nr:nicotinate-nucleotide diphosphorylase (carboxylating) [Flavobacteriales bacterium]